jgi:ligand-binding sensor domain-containing protein
VSGAWLLLASLAAAGEVTRYPSLTRVTGFRAADDGLVVTAEDGETTLGLTPMTTEAFDGKRECVYEPHPDGVMRTCKRLQNEVIPIGGFTATATAFHDGKHYAGTYGGGLRLIPSGTRIEGIPDAVTALMATEQGLLVGTEDGLYLLGETLERLPVAGPGDGHIATIVKAEDALFVGHFDRGLSRLKDGRWTHWTTRDGLPTDWVDELAWDGTRLWGATEKGVFWLEGERLVTPQAPPLREATTALAVSSGAVWLAQAGRIVVWKDGVEKVIEHDEKNPQRLFVEGGVAWLAGVDGLRRLGPEGARRYGALDASLPGDWATAVAPGPGGLWVGTYDAGLIRLSTAGWTALKGDAWVNLGALAVDGERAAVGEMDGGLWLYEGGGWRRFGRAQGLPGEDVSAVLFDGGALWVGTRTGLARLEL